jgi:predicted ATP-grasp superfamily ATP-dependent carboligase
MNVIVTNAKNRLAYLVAKSLGEKGLGVYTADFVPFSMAFASRYSRGHFLYPSPFRDQEKFVSCLIENIRRLRAEVLIPVFEETFLIAKYKNEIGRHVRMAIPDYEQILIAHNKDRWLSLAGNMGIPVPQSLEIAEIRQNPEKIGRLAFPILIKPKQGGGAWGIRQVNSPRELNPILEKDSYLERPWERFFVQEKIEGTVYCVAMLLDKGSLKGHVVYKQLRDFPFSGGQATLRVSVDHPSSVAHLQRFLGSLNWHGVCQADFLVDRKTQIPYLIDINPRFWGSLVQGIACGVDFPYMLFKIACGEKVEAVPGFKKGIKTRWIWGDLRTLPQALKATKKKFGLIKEYIRLFNGRVQFDDFCLRDPLPFFMFGLDFLHKFLKSGTLSPVSHDSLEGIWE